LSEKSAITKIRKAVIPGGGFREDEAWNTGLSIDPSNRKEEDERLAPGWKNSSITHDWKTTRIARLYCAQGVNPEGAHLEKKKGRFPQQTRCGKQSYEKSFVHGEESQPGRRTLQEENYANSFVAITTFPCPREKTFADRYGGKGGDCVFPKEKGLPEV